MATSTGPLNAVTMVLLRSQRRLSTLPPSVHRASAKQSLLAAIGLARGPSRRALGEVTRNLAVMVSAHLPLVEALGAAVRQTSDPQLRRMLADVKADIECGMRFSKSLARRSAFGPLAVHLVEVGESTGLLGEVLMRLAEHQEKSEALRRRVRQAMTYPAFVIGIAVVATAFLLAFVVPTFAGLYADFDADLPRPTRFVLVLSDSMTAHAPLALAGCALMAVGIRRALTTLRGRQLRDTLLLRLPVVGRLVRQSLAARFSRTLSTLLENGVPLADALALLARSSENAVLSDQLARLLEAVERGEPLASSLPRETLFPPVLVHLAAAGEATGRLEHVLRQAADHYEMEVEMTTGSLATLLEPVLIVVIGAILGGVLVAMYLPLFDLVNIMGF